MSFVAYLGSAEQLDSWRSRVCQHAQWLGKSCELRTLECGTGHRFAYGALGSAVADLPYRVRGDRVVLSTTALLPGMADPESRCGLVEIEVSRATAALRVTMPFTTPEHLFWTRAGGATILSNDFRALLRWTGMELDETALVGLLSLGAIPAPLSLCRRVARIPSGHRWELAPEDDDPRIESLALDLPRETPDTADDSERLVVDRLDSVLTRTPQGSLLYFSGGVDSALIAARLRALGRGDVELVHYAFHDHDPETAVARAIAKHLGLRFHRIVQRDDEVMSLLDRLGAEYSCPFGDFSALPTNYLVARSLGDHGGRPAVLEGTGADGAFAVGLKSRLWRRVFLVPRVVRTLVSGLLGRSALRPWHYGRLADLALRTSKRSTRWPPWLAGVVSQTPYDGITFDMPPRAWWRLRDSLERYVAGPAANESLATRLAFADLVHVCAGRFAQKSFDPLRARGCRPIYPFLDPGLVSASLAIPWDVKCKDGEPKAILKRILAREVPHHLVYRPKRGFEPPLRSMLRAPAVAQVLRETLDPNRNPLMSSVNVPAYRSLVDAVLHSAQPVTFTALCALWMNIFMTQWMDQIRPCSSPSWRSPAVVQPALPAVSD